jgi:hypothetical protein
MIYSFYLLSFAMLLLSWIIMIVVLDMDHVKCVETLPFFAEKNNYGCGEDDEPGSNGLNASVESRPACHDGVYQHSVCPVVHSDCRPY